ncbi:MAG: hypothetical protein IPG54_08920 [Sphingomonadales bacterium]|jgi:hypothetical protein|nr:hypothetical protein [Sphingomonadales bacterium]MBK9004960.1 hypothetical protein [Sphingomonadales bacterium]MBK9267307.1 hypothetical protein [Sphingomonadales bacterium]MBP6434016.1 hypothetical protein [Sphingorhabdus sp.]
MTIILGIIASLSPVAISAEAMSSPQPKLQEEDERLATTPATLAEIIQTCGKFLRSEIDANSLAAGGWKNQDGALVLRLPRGYTDMNARGCRGSHTISKKHSAELKSTISTTLGTSASEDPRGAVTWSKDGVLTTLAVSGGREAHPTFSINFAVRLAGERN